MTQQKQEPTIGQELADFLEEVYNETQEIKSQY